MLHGPCIYHIRESVEDSRAVDYGGTSQNDSNVSLVLRLQVTINWNDAIPVFDIVEILFWIHFFNKWQSDNQPTL